MTTRDTPEDGEQFLPRQTAPLRPITPQAALHAVVCRVRPDGTSHSFVFDPQGILSDCRYLLASEALAAFTRDAEIEEAVQRLQALIAHGRYEQMDGPKAATMALDDLLVSLGVLHG
jgi:hypothetical protein